MSTITLPNIRVSSDLTVKVRLKDSGVAIDWSTLNNVKASIYSDAQRALAGRCDVSIDAEDPTLLVCQYAANKPQYVGVNRIVVSAKYHGETKTYDKPAFSFVRWTGDQAGEQITIDDPDVDVEIDVEDVSSSILDEAIRAAFAGAERANDVADSLAGVEADVEAAEALRVAAEESRVEAEEDRVEAEAARVDEEAVRVSAEDARVVAENAREAAEDLREGAEDDRAAAETARETAEAARVAAEALRVSAEGSRESAEAARAAQASADHTVAAGDHTQAAADHTQAAADHTTAASDHTQASSDHTLAAADHTTAAADHTQAQADHAVMEGYDDRLDSVESEVSQLEAKVLGFDYDGEFVISATGEHSSNSDRITFEKPIPEGEYNFTIKTGTTGNAGYCELFVKYVGSNSNTSLGSQAIGSTKKVTLDGAIKSIGVYMGSSVNQHVGTMPLTIETTTSLKRQIDNKIDAAELDYTDVEHEVTTGIITLTGAATTSNNWDRFIFRNNGYSRIKVTAYTSANYMAIAFYNSETWGADSFMESASIVGKNYTQNYDVVVPDGCKTIIVCNWKRYRALPIIKLYSTDISANLKKIQTVQTSIHVLGKALSISNADKKIEDYTIYYSSGNLTTSSGKNVYLFKNYGYTKVEAHLGANSATFAAIAFYNSETPSADSFISAIPSINDMARDYSADVPANCKLIAVSANEATVTPSVTIYLEKTQSAFDKMDERYNDLKAKIGDNTDIVSLNDPIRTPHILQQMKFTGGVKNPTSVNPLVLLHFSDIHGGNTETHYVINKETLQRIIDFNSAYSNYIDDMICTGDECFQDITDRQNPSGGTNWWDAVVGTDKILPVIGNHDTYASGSTENGSAGKEATYAALFNHISDANPSDHTEGNCYYYKDYTTPGIRLIVVDPYYSDTAEVEWFQQALADAKTNGMSVVVAVHPPFAEYTPLDCTFNSLRFSGEFTQHVDMAAYINAVEEFIVDGGLFICWLTGHVHGDVVGYYEHNGIKQLAIGAPSAKAPRSAGTSSETNNVDMRILGTKSQDSFNLISFETAYKTLTIKRIGSDYDVALRHRGICTINYETMQVLYND